MKKTTFYFLIASLAICIVGCQSNTQEPSEQDKVVDLPVSTKSEEAKAAVLSGLEIWDLGNAQDAHDYFTKALEKDPKLAIAHVFAGITGGSAEAFGTGLANAKANLDGATDFEKQIIAYVETYAKNDPGARLTITQKMVEDYPDAPRCQINLGDTYWGKNEVKLSRDCYQKAIALDPNWTIGYNKLASSYLFADPIDLAKAESNATKVVELAGNNPKAHILLGDCYRGQNKLEQARDAYAKSIQLAPEDFESYYKKGHANTYLGNMEEARTDFQNGRKYDKNKNVGFEAFTYLYADDAKTALSWLEGKLATVESLGLSADRMAGAKLDMLDDCAWMAFHQGKHGKLKAFKDQMAPLSKQAAKSVGTPEALINHESDMLFWDALIAAIQGKTDDATSKLTQFETSVKSIKNPRKMESYHFANGFVHIQKKDYKGAVVEFEKANKDWIYNQYWLAKANEMAGNKEKANELYRKVASDNFNSVYNGLVRSEVKQKTASS